MGQSVLSSQFVAGLIPELKTKVAGVEGDLGKLLTKARFEEAKLRDLAGGIKQPSTPKPKSEHPPTQLDRNQKRPITCYVCGATGHKAFQCRNRGRGAGKDDPRAVNALATDET